MLILAGNFTWVTHTLQEMKEPLAFLDDILRVREPLLESISEFLDVSELHTVPQSSPPEGGDRSNQEPR